MSEREGLTAHQQAVLDLPVEVLAGEVLLGWDLKNISKTPSGTYVFTVDVAEQPAPKATVSWAVWGTVFCFAFLLGLLFGFPGVSK